jgi:hypothetical protein
MSESSVGVVQQLFTDGKRASVSVEKKVFYSIHFDIATKLVRPIKLCLNGAFCEIHIDKYFSYAEQLKTRRYFIATALIVALECLFLVSCCSYSSTLKIVPKSWWTFTVLHSVTCQMIILFVD